MKLKHGRTSRNCREMPVSKRSCGNTLNPDIYRVSPREVGLLNSLNVRSFLLVIDKSGRVVLVFRNCIWS